MPIEPVAPRLERFIDLDQAVEWLASGFGGDGRAMGYRGGRRKARSGSRKVATCCSATSGRIGG
jgi:hypothetical protein